MAPREVPEAATDAELHAQCLDQASGLCVLALLDAADPALEAHLGILKLAAGKWAKQPLHFSWVNAARQVGPCSCPPSMHNQDACNDGQVPKENIHLAGVEPTSGRMIWSS